MSVVRGGKMYYRVYRGARVSARGVEPRMDTNLHEL